jgi:hypothetical protein
MPSLANRSVAPSWRSTMEITLTTLQSRPLTAATAFIAESPFVVTSSIMMTLAPSRICPSISFFVPWFLAISRTKKPFRGRSGQLLERRADPRHPEPSRRFHPRRSGTAPRCRRLGKEGGDRGSDDGAAAAPAVRRTVRPGSCLSRTNHGSVSLLDSRGCAIAARSALALSVRRGHLPTGSRPAAGSAEIAPAEPEPAPPCGTRSVLLPRTLPNRRL